MKRSAQFFAAGSVLLILILAGVSLFSTTGSFHASSPSVSVPILATSPNLVEQTVRQLAWGNILFNAPDTMQYEKAETLELALSPVHSVADLQAQIDQVTGVDSAKARMSNRMEAQLTGSGFTIEALAPALQAVTMHEITRWRWDVTPTQPGRQRLHLALSAHIDVTGHDAPFVVRTFARQIQVEITVPQRFRGFVQNNWQWLWAFLVPILIYVWKRAKAYRWVVPRREA